ncbi:MAG: radical SAM protein [Desulfurococcales archaeon]|nr:radical SAM protein [Desulfurococcales archaeon]
MSGLIVDKMLVEKLMRIKEDVMLDVARSIGREGVRKASSDWHARRRPIPCGLTIHTGVGCSYGCSYCYIYDMGFTSKPKPYPLSGSELVYALSINPYFVPGFHGTLLAFGSVTEPFMRETLDRALEYLSYTRDLLGNPQQVSTKTALKGNDFYRFVESVDPKIDVLVSITTLRHWRVLEPGASPPEDRFRFMRELIETGLNATLFLRPILPGVTDREADCILELAVDNNVRRVVLGTLRVTPGILKRLGATRIVDVREIKARLPREPRNRRDQVIIRGRDLKETIAYKARSLGLEVLPASCSSNIASHQLACAACNMGPCGDTSILPKASIDGVEAVLEHAGIEPLRVSIGEYTVEYWYRGSRRNADIANSWISSLLKRIPIPHQVN